MMNDTSVLATHIMTFVRAEKSRQFLFAEYQKALKVNKLRQQITESKPPIQEFLKVLNPTASSVPESVPAIQVNLSESETDNCVWIVPTITKSHKSTKSGLVDRLSQALVNPDLAEGLAQTLSARAVAVAVFVLAAAVDTCLSSNMLDMNEKDLAQQILNSLETPAKPPTSSIKLVSKLPSNLDSGRVYYLRPDATH